MTTSKSYGFYSSKLFGMILEPLREYDEHTSADLEETDRLIVLREEQQHGANDHGSEPFVGGDYACDRNLHSSCLCGCSFSNR